MKASTPHLLVLGATILVALAGAATAQPLARRAVVGALERAAPAAARQAAPLAAPRGMVQDWSQRFSVYSNPDTPEDAALKGRTAQWRQAYQDPRFAVAVLRKLQMQAEAKGGRVAAAGKPAAPTPGPVASGQAIQRDWSQVSGGGTNGLGGFGSPNTYPAKYNFDVTQPPSCTGDFVVFGTSAVGASSTGTSETWVASFTGDPAVLETVVIGTATPRTITLTAHGTLNTGTNFQFTGNNTTNATNLSGAINRWAHQTGYRASSSGAQVTVTSNTADNITTAPVVENLANFGNFVNTNGTAAPGQPTIMAMNQLYNTTCNTGTGRANDNGPNVMWSYNTGNGATVTTSPVLSLYDQGKQVAFIQSTGGVASLVLLKWQAGDGTAAAPVTPTTVAAAAYRTCVAPCMTLLTLNGSPGVSHSSPYVIYGGDRLYVGDNAGVLHRFNGVFRTGTPTEQVSLGFPATVSAGNALSSPVYDFTNNQVMVGSARGAATGGQLHRVSAAAGAVTSSGVLVTTAAANPGLRSGPIVDGSTAKTMVFVANDGVNGCNAGGGANTAPCRAIYQFDNLFAAGNTGTKATIGVGNTTNRVQYAGAFEANYYTAGTGAMYACGMGNGTAAAATTLTMWKIPFATGTIGAPTMGAAVSLTGSTGDCSPVTEVLNGSDYIYVGVPTHANDGATNVCGGLATSSCLYMFNLQSLNSQQEIWTLTITGPGTFNGENVVVNGTTTTGGTHWATANRNTSARNIADYINANSGTLGMTAVGTGGSSAFVVMTAITSGDKADAGFTETLANGSYAKTQDGAQGATVWATTNVPAAGLSVPGGTTGLVIDNYSATAGNSQVYFMGLTAPGNATQASQSGLQ